MRVVEQRQLAESRKMRQLQPLWEAPASAAGNDRAYHHIMVTGKTTTDKPCNSVERSRAAAQLLKKTGPSC